MEENNKSQIQDVASKADQLSSSVNILNKGINGLQDSQKKLSDSFQNTSKIFKDNLSSIQDIAGALKNTNQIFQENAGALNNSTAALSQNKAQLNDFSNQLGELNKKQATNNKTINDLNSRFGDLSSAIEEQGKKLVKSQQTFDFYGKSIDAVTSSFDKLKKGAGDFAPQLETAAKGFNAMKDGLKVVREGFTSVGGAIKATGFGLLVLMLQSLTEWLNKSTKGQKVLHGALNAIGKVTEVINKAFLNLGGAIFNALIHPVESIKSVWSDISTFFGKIFDPIGKMINGLTHLNVIEMKQGYNELTSNMKGIAHGIVDTFKKAKEGIVDLVKTGVEAYEEGYNIKPKKSGLNDKLSSTKNTQIEKQNLDTAFKEGISKDDPKQQLEQLQENADEQFKISRDNEVRILKDKKESIKKQIAIEKVKVAAQRNLQDEYLNAVIKTTSSVMSLFGRYTVAAKAAFKTEQATAAAQVIINTQRAIMGIWSTDSEIPFVGVPKAIAETAIAAAAGASSLATILKQKPGFARGGRFVSDGRAALLPGYSRTDNTNAYLRSGEAVVVSEAMQNPWARNLVSAINVAHGGRDFSLPNTGRGYAIGGIFTDGGNANRYYSQPVNDQKDLANTLAYQMINNFPPIYVDVKDVNNQQNILAQTVNRVNL